MPNNLYSSSWASPDPGNPLSQAILAGQLGWDLEEGDDLHPAANVAKMQAGTPLTDEDRWPWLDSVADWIYDHTRAGIPGIITCSALKRIYRDRMRGDNVVFVHLAGNKDTIARRLNARLEPLHADRRCSTRRSTPWSRRGRTRTPWSSTWAGNRQKRPPRSSPGSACSCGDRLVHPGLRSSRQLVGAGAGGPLEQPCSAGAGRRARKLTRLAQKASPTSRPRWSLPPAAST